MITVESTKESGVMIRELDEGLSSSRMAISIKASMQLAKHMAKVMALTLLLLGLFLKLLAMVKAKRDAKNNLDRRNLISG